MESNSAGNEYSESSIDARASNATDSNIVHKEISDSYTNVHDMSNQGNSTNQYETASSGELDDKEDTKEQEQKLSFSTTKPVSITVRQLSIASRTKNGTRGLLQKLGFKKEKLSSTDIENSEDMKPILHSMSFNIPKGTVTAIMGGSGSGKTTLLNALSHRQSISGSSLAQSGEILFNGQDDINTIRHAYVIQQDILLPTLTCFETLLYAAELRLPKLTSKESRKILVEEIILELGLKECRDTMVGDRVHKGLSGGEKRRLSIGIQMMSNPSVLFLDEPTTGLDAFNAFQLCLTLKKLAAKGKTFIISIHQPRSDIFKLFDQVLILSKGKLCYGDSGSEIINYFNNLGYFVPDMTNPADFLVDITSVDNRTPIAEEKTLKLVKLISEEWKIKMKAIENDSQFEEKILKENDNNIRISDGEGNDMEQVFEKVGKTPFLRELNILVRRNLKLQFRDPLGYASLLAESILLGLVTGWLFFRPGTSLLGIRTIQGALYIVSSLQVYLLLLYEAFRLCNLDIKIFDRERSEGCVSIFGFLLARRISKLLTEDAIIPFLYSISTYFMFGLRTDSPVYFFRYWAGNMIFHINTMSFAMLAASLSRDVSIASLICNLNFTFQSMANGYFVNAVQMPVYVRWCKYVAYLWYSFGFLISNQFTDFMGDCDPDTGVDQCAAYSGTYILESLGFWRNWVALPLCVVLAFAIGTYICAGVVLKLKPVDMTLAKEVKTAKVNSVDEDEPDKEGHIELAEANSVNINAGNDEKPVDLILKDLCLGVDIKSPLNFFKKGEKQYSDHKVILNEVNAVFSSGKLNAIMGPSGSGKSSLLNLISGRVSSSLMTRYSSSGKVYFNEYAVNDKVIRSICSYVSQDDDNLLSSITVKETLMFAARLRLSRSGLSYSQIENRVMGIILKLGLRDCQNTLIGSELVKGISGGEKRRVSIGIQLLNDPKVLFLDEPTSGLDSFTASSILEILENLTKEGKTVIMTIHQPRFDLFNRFGSVLLLAKGGQVGFNGSPNELVEYFDKLGYPVPTFTNAADHVLDIISYNMQNEYIERQTRKRVGFLLDNWKTNEGSINRDPFQESRGVNEKCLNSIKESLGVFGSSYKTRASFYVGLRVLLQRQTLCLFRDLNILIARCTQVVGMGIILSLFYARLKHSYDSIQDRLGLVQQIASLYFVGFLNNLSSFLPERDYFYEEYFDEVVDIPSFFIAYLIIELPFEIFSCLVYSVFLVFVIGLPMTAKVFFSIFYSSFIIVNAGESLGMSFNIMVKHAGFAVNIISLFASVATSMAGLIAMDLDGFLKAINWISPSHYGVYITANVVFTSDLHFTCGPSTMLANGECIFATGQDVRDLYKLNADLAKLFGLSALIVVIDRVISYLLLKFKLLRISVGDFKNKIGLNNKSNKLN
ncbi:hypothetical protein B5S31_g1159 [[Candida] boidinii]|nr:hypothetical protein B5S29_g656 [[Candida] boidinii]OWB71470.1 hypothetical protein B5S31_g1159 [[Candida] boidinii]